MLHAVKGAAADACACARPRIGVAVLAQIAIRRDQSPGARRRILDDIVERWPHHRDHAVDQRARREVLTRP